MGKRVVRVMFSDGAKMYSPYSTVSDYMSPVIVALPDELERLMEEGAGDGQEDEAKTLWHIVQNGNFPDCLPDDVPVEQVICTVLFYDDPPQTWPSFAKRAKGSGVVTGYLTHDDWYLNKMDREMEIEDRGIETSSMPPRPKQPRLKLFLKKFGLLV